MSYDTTQRARFVVGTALQFVGAFKFVTAGTIDNIRRCGAYDDNDGHFFELDGTVFSIGSRNTTIDTLVSSGSFNGDWGTTFTPTANTYYKLDIEWTPLGVFYYVNNILLHSKLVGHLTNRLTLPIRFENINDNGSTAAVVFDCLGVAILRQGKLITNPIYKYISGAKSTLCKVGAGDLHIIVNNDNAGSIIVYDGTSAAGVIMASVDLAKVLGTLTFEAPFNHGLFIVSTGVGVRVSVMYE